MNNNQRANQISIQKFRKELMAMMEDIQLIDEKILNKAVNVGLAEVKQNTPVGNYPSHVSFVTKEGKQVEFDVAKKTGGFMKKQWHVSPTNRTANGVEKKLYNLADYASYINYGHRIVKSRITVGFVKGRFMLEKAVAKVNKILEIEFNKEIERVNRDHDK